MAPLLADGSSVPVSKSVVSRDPLEFSRACREIASNHRNGPRSIDALFHEVCIAIEEAGGLGLREKDRRLRIVLGECSLSSGELEELLRTAEKSAPTVVNTLLAMLPPGLRRLRAAPKGAEPSDNDNQVGTTQSPETAAVQPPAPPHRRPSDSGTPIGAFWAVALVGGLEEHLNNRALLEARSLRGLHAADIQSLEQLATTGLCGIVVASSIWNASPAEEHESILRRLCSLSTLLFVRLATRGLSLRVASRLHSIHAELACGSGPATHFCHGEDGQLTPADVTVLHGVADLLADAEGANFQIMGLGPPEATLLGAVLARRGERRATGVSLRALATKELTGGRSGATVLLVAPSDGLAPVVFKIDTAEHLRTEIIAYQRWLKEWEFGVAAPEFHSHLGKAVLTYNLRASPDSSITPAPTLEERLGELRGAEIWEPVATALSLAGDLEKALTRTVSELGRLAACPGDGAAAQEFWLDWSTKALATRGIVVKLRDTHDNDIDIATLVEVAGTRVRRLWGRSVNHGDIQARNVLLQDRLPVFIDFARSGPGHPCYDLVTLDGSVRHLLFRLLDNERSAALFMRRLYVDGLAYEGLATEFPTLLSSPSNQLVAKCAVQIRRTAIEILARYDGYCLDYLALTAVASAWLLAQLVCSSGVERAVLAGISRSVLDGLSTKSAGPGGPVTTGSK